jgi:hypothetical protein
MASRRQLQHLACVRLKEAEALYNSDCYDGCAYLCGYVIELGLKAAICSRLGVDDYPEKGSRLRDALRTHDFDDLKLLAGMDRAFEASASSLANWSLASEWTPERRYDPAGTFDRVTAEAILEAVRNYPDGILACISTYW